MAHKGARNDLTAAEIRSILDYDPDTGILTWTQSPQLRWIGKRAGHRRRDNNIYVWIKRHGYLAHRLIWLWMTGEWPKYEIDHRDLDRSNNQWSNLREATSSQNAANKKRRSDSTNAFKGIAFNPKKGRYWASIQFNKKRYHIGVFDTAEDAYAAYCARAMELHGEFHRLT